MPARRPAPVETRRLEPAWGGHLIQRLQEEGIIPRHVTRLIIDCNTDNFVYIHLMVAPQDGDQFIDVLAAELAPAMIAGVDPDA